MEKPNSEALEKLKVMELRYESAQARLSDSAVYADAERLRTLNRELWSCRR